MPILVLTLLVFVGMGIALLLGPLLIGRLVRPNKPTPQKEEIYECGEEPVGSAWIQFDLRFYVVALLFVIFDVEIVFFFPWAIVFGSATRAADPTLAVEQRIEATSNLTASGTATAPADPAMMTALAQFAFLEMLVFFGILLVGFAYFWKRGDLEWIRGIARMPLPTTTPTPPPPTHAS